MISLLVYIGAANQAELTKRWTELLNNNSVCCVADVQYCLNLLTSVGAFSHNYLINELV